jgi:ferredoxin
MPKPRVLQKYEVDESRCILCGICVDACPYDALRDGADVELAHGSREQPMIDLLAIAAVERETEVTYIRKERDWMARATAEGRIIQSDRLLPVLPATIAGNGNGHGNGHGNGRDGHDHGHDGHGHGAASGGAAAHHR